MRKEMYKPIFENGKMDVEVKPPPQFKIGDEFQGGIITKLSPLFRGKCTYATTITIEKGD